jgi:hypothetical protein
VTAVTFVAPAREPWSGAHLLDTGRDCALPGAGEGHLSGWTVCGRELSPGELWRVVEPGDAQPVCGGCRGVETQEGMW